MTEQGFIPEFRDFILEHIPTSPDWAESIAISLLSTAVGGDRFVRSKIGRLSLNLWFLMIGPSGLAYKSTPLNYFVFPTLIALTEHVEYPTVMPARYSMEGLIEYLSTRCSQGSIVRDEFTTLFKETTKNYLSDNLEFLSELYDGTMQKRFTRKTKLEEATNVYVTFLSATTPYLYQIMKPGFFVQGTGNRILYILFEGLAEKDLDDTPEDFFYDIRQDKEREDKLKNFAKLLGEVNKCPVKQLAPDMPAGKLWLDFRKDLFMNAKNRFSNDIYDLFYTYMVRIPEFTLKLSALKRLSNVYKNLAYSKLSEMIVNEDDMEWAIQKAKKYLQYFQKLLTSWSTRPEPEEPKTLGEAINAVHNILLDKPDGMSWAEFRRKITWTRWSLSDVLVALFDQERVIFVIGKHEGAGRKPTLLFAKEYENNTLEYEKIETWDRFAYRTHLKK